jgi:protein-L-isoaspartate(D-aspartate) O-methyltransferase
MSSDGDRMKDRPEGSSAWSRCAAVFALVVWGMTMGGCDPEEENANKSQDEIWAERRDRMVEQQIAARGVRDPQVLESMRTVPRHLFVPENSREGAYRDSPLPIGENQTISQPYIVALMTELLEVEPGDKVLEIGTGSGYQAAVLAEMGVQVHSIEIRPRLCERAASTLAGLGYTLAQVRCGDGYGGWPEEAPFDGVIVTAAPERVPGPLIEQLEMGARMVIPVGAFYQELKVFTRTEEGVDERSVIPVRFVPMTGEIEKF